MLKKISKTVISVIEDSTIHGLPNIVKKERIINKIMWALVFLASFGYCTYFIVNSILAFLEYEAITQLETVFEQPTQFFTIQFCSRDSVSFNNKTLVSILRQCVFNYDTACLTNPEAWFESYIDPSFFQCYRFNSGKNLNGSSIPLLRSSIGGLDDSFILEIIAPVGLVYWIHNYTTPPHREFKNNHNGDTQLASPGFETHSVVDRTFEYKLEYPFNNCLNDPTTFSLNKTIINFMINKSIPYSQVNCLELCFDMQYLIDKPCNCANASFGNVWNNCFGNKFTSFESTACTIKYKTKWYDQALVENYANYCPLECNSITYSVSNRILSNMLNKNSSSIIAYYRTLKYTVISQVPSMKLLDLISFIGGLTGLFLGASFLSVIEIFEMINGIIFYLIEELIERYKKERKNKRKIRQVIAVPE